jgi:hypothetical protein
LLIEVRTRPMQLNGEALHLQKSERKLLTNK